MVQTSPELLSESFEHLTHTDKSLRIARHHYTYKFLFSKSMWINSLRKDQKDTWLKDNRWRTHCQWFRGGASRRLTPFFLSQHTSIHSSFSSPPRIFPSALQYFITHTCLALPTFSSLPHSIFLSSILYLSFKSLFFSFSPFPSLIPLLPLRLRVPFLFFFFSSLVISFPLPLC